MRKEARAVAPIAQPSFRQLKFGPCFSMRNPVEGLGLCYGLENFGSISGPMQPITKATKATTRILRPMCSNALPNGIMASKHGELWGSWCLMLGVSKDTVASPCVVTVTAPLMSKSTSEDVVMVPFSVPFSTSSATI